MTDMLTGIVTTKPDQGTNYLWARIGGTDLPVRVFCVRAVLTTAQVGDQILITQDGRQLWATNVLGWATATPATGSTLGRGVILPERASYLSGSDGVDPVWAGTWEQGWRMDLGAVECGSPQPGRSARRGAVFFGPGLRGRGTITTATLTMGRLTGGINTPQIVPVTLLAGDSDQPGIYPTVLASVDGPALGIGQTVDWPLPTAWLPRLGAGGDAGGIGVGTGGPNPYLRLDWPTLIFDWRTT